MPPSRPPRPRALDLFCGAGGVSEGLRRAGFDVTSVDINPACRAYHRGGKFICADALTFPLEGYDFIWASPLCQAHSRLRSLHPTREYLDLIPQTLDRLMSAPAYTHWCVENVVGAPIDWNLLLCGTMFGLTTADGRAELQRHRIFMTTFAVRQPACYHGGARESLTVSGTGMGVGNKGEEAHMRERRRALTVTGHSYQTHRRAVLCIGGGKAMSGGMSKSQAYLAGRATTTRERYTVEDARHTMGISWMPMRFLSQAIPPIYAQYIGRACKRVLACD